MGGRVLWMPHCRVHLRDNAKNASRSASARGAVDASNAHCFVVHYVTAGGRVENCVMEIRVDASLLQRVVGSCRYCLKGFHVENVFFSQCTEVRTVLFARLLDETCEHAVLVTMHILDSDICNDCNEFKQRN